jgi:hypothetical protein
MGTIAEENIWTQLEVAGGCSELLRGLHSLLNINKVTKQ